MLLLGERTCCHSQIHVPKTSTWRLVVLIVECLSNLEVPNFHILYMYVNIYKYLHTYIHDVKQ